VNYFTDHELACRHCGQIKLAEGFRDKLNVLRQAVNFPLAVNSCCRCPEWNDHIGGKKNSFHLISHPWGCCAVDISTVAWTSAKLWRFVSTAMKHGWSVGINFQKAFVHLDRRSDHDTGWELPVLFPY
jgi:hypothetical protein